MKTYSQKVLWAMQLAVKSLTSKTAVAAETLAAAARRVAAENFILVVFVGLVLELFVCVVVVVVVLK